MAMSKVSRPGCHAQRTTARLHSPRREILNAVFYVLKAGCQWWRMLPKDFPPWKTLYYYYYYYHYYHYYHYYYYYYYYYYFSRWRVDGTWERTNRAIRQRLRALAAGRSPDPSAAVVDSQSPQRDHRGGRRGARLRHGGKKVRGRKRHILVDTARGYSSK